MFVLLLPNPRDDTMERCKGVDRIPVLGLQVLDNVIMTRWKVLPREQCQGKYLRLRVGAGR
jgi:hypothetical protein